MRDACSAIWEVCRGLWEACEASLEACTTLWEAGHSVMPVGLFARPVWPVGLFGKPVWLLGKLLGCGEQVELVDTSVRFLGGLYKYLAALYVSLVCM